MDMLLQYLKSLISFPVRLASEPDAASAIFVVSNNRAARKRVFGFLGLLVISSVAMLGCGPDQKAVQQAELKEDEVRYQKVSQELTDLAKEVAQKQLAMSGSINPKQVVPEEVKEKVRGLQEEQERLLKKMISVNPANQKYRFELSKVKAAKGEAEEALNLLRGLAPEDVPGYLPAHLVLATQYFERKSATQNERMQNLTTALKHTKSVLTRKKDNLQARLLQAKILVNLQRFDEAYAIYEDLSELNPNYYREMVALNKQLKREDQNQAVCETALSRFLALAEKEENQKDDKRWIVIETGIAKTRQRLGGFEEMESRLKQLIANYTADPKGGTRRVFLQQLLADGYVVWAGRLAGSTASYDSLPPETLTEMVDLYAKAYVNHPDHPVVLQSLTRLSLFPNQAIASRARAVYDPLRDIDAPGAVLNQLGNHKLIAKEFSQAIRFYEQARAKKPRDPAILNNLAYSYLVATDDRNAERALRLVNEAIRFLPKGIGPAELAKFMHTKATALKQMDRLQEALQIFENSLQARPNHEDTLRSLVECYHGLNKTPPERYLAELEKFDAEKR